MDIQVDHLPPQQLSSDSTLSGWTLYPEQIFDYAGAAGGSYEAPHHVNDEQNDYYQQVQYGHCQDTYYVTTQTETPQHSNLPPADAAMSYWPTAQVPLVATDPMSTTPPMDSSLYHIPSQSYYGNQDLSSTELHYHAPAVDQFQSIPYSESYGAASYPDVSPSTTAAAPSAVTAIPAFVPHPTIAPHQSESGHDPMPQDATAHTALCEGAATFQTTTDTNYAQMGPYAPVPAQEREQPYMTAYTPASPPAPVPAPSPAPARPSKRKARSQSLGIRSRDRSPMGHLPYQEDIAKAGIKSRRSSVFSGLSSSRSSTPRPPSPFLQTLTFITYPDLEPKGHGRGGDCDGTGDDDEDGSPRRGRRGKKQPKKEPFLACYFCRGRKIACHPKSDGGDDRTCTQCSKRRLDCEYPHISRRGQRKPQDPDAVAAAAAAAATTSTTACKPRAARPSSKRSASSFVRI